MPCIYRLERYQKLCLIIKYNCILIVHWLQEEPTQVRNLFVQSDTRFYRTLVLQDK